MTDGLLLLIQFFSWWTVILGIYAAVLFGLDAVLAAAQRRHQVLRRRQAEAARIRRDATQSLQRINAAFLVALQLIRDEAAASRDSRR